MPPHVYVVFSLVACVHVALAWLRVPDAAAHAASLAMAVLALLTPTRSARRATDGAPSEESEARDLLMAWARRDPAIVADEVLAAQALTVVRSSRDVVGAVKVAIDDTPSERPTEPEVSK